SPRFPHHRISRSDGNEDPVPGLIMGGPNGSLDDAHRCPVAYPSRKAAKAYVDHACSYASNENAINYNSAFVAVCGGVEAVKAGNLSQALSLPDRKIVSSTQNGLEVKNKLKLFPNPANNDLHVQFNSEGTTIDLQVSDLTGKVWLQKNTVSSGNGDVKLDVSFLPSGIYIIRITNDGIAQYAKFIKQ
ncbi:MAG: T9SS type A sorting domain-containing protein, partial [Cytophagaceae bacterium]